MKKMKEVGFAVESDKDVNGVYLSINGDQNEVKNALLQAMHSDKYVAQIILDVHKAYLEICKNQAQTIASENEIIYIFHSKDQFSPMSFDSDKLAIEAARKTIGVNKVVKISNNDSSVGEKVIWIRSNNELLN